MLRLSAFSFFVRLDQYIAKAPLQNGFCQDTAKGVELPMSQKSQKFTDQHLPPNTLPDL
jgi:hypothetical protein